MKMGYDCQIKIRQCRDFFIDGSPTLSCGFLSDAQGYSNQVLGAIARIKI